MDAVEVELLAMLADPERRKRYFAIVELEKIAENDYNLNIPRYVETFEPEADIPLLHAMKSLRESLEAERQAQVRLDILLGTLP